MAESKIAPGELFKKSSLVKIPDLERKPNDLFHVFSVADYVKIVKAAIASTTIPRGYKAYLTDLVEHVNGYPAPKLKVEPSYTAFKKEVDLLEVAKYFGEIIGPLYVVRTTTNNSHIVFPERSNYELFDYFVRRGGKHVGYSAKAEGGATNTLVPRLIAERIEAQKKGANKDLGIDIVLQLANEPTFKGTVQAVGMLAKKGIFPATMKADSMLQASFKKINFAADATIIEQNKNGKLQALTLSGKTAYLQFLGNHVVPRMKTASGSPANWTATNLIYGLISMYLADVSKEGAFNLTPTIRKLFPDLNIVKMGVNQTGVPHFRIIAKGAVEEVTLRSKARWSVIKDKLGVQL